MQPFERLTSSPQLRTSRACAKSACTADGCAALLLETMPLVMNAVRGVICANQEPQLTVPQFRTLLFVQRNEGASLSAAAEYLGLTLPSTSKLVDHLVKRKLLDRNNDRDDRRRMTLRITPEGGALLGGAQDAVRMHLAGILKQFEPGDLTVLQNALGLLQESFPSASLDLCRQRQRMDIVEKS